jgi:hypothetical protein
MDYDAMRFWLEVVIIIVNVGLWLFVWNSNKSRVTKDQLDEHAVTLAAFDERLKNAIGHPELSPIYERMNGMDSKLAEINGKMHTLDLIHEWLINGGKS